MQADGLKWKFVPATLVEDQTDGQGADFPLPIA
jgi:hypothetical protein